MFSDSLFATGKIHVDSFHSHPLINRRMQRNTTVRLQLVHDQVGRQWLIDPKSGPARIIVPKWEYSLLILCFRVPDQIESVGGLDLKSPGSYGNKSQGAAHDLAYPQCACLPSHDSLTWNALLSSPLLSRYIHADRRTSHGYKLHIHQRNVCASVGWYRGAQRHAVGRSLHCSIQNE